MSGERVVVVVLVVVGLLVLRLEALHRISRLSIPGHGSAVRRARLALIVKVLVRPLRPGLVPRDPFRLSAVVRVDPLGDGRPGETFLAPVPDERRGPAPVNADGSRQDASIVLSRRARFVVVCLGRVGEVGPLGETLPAAARVARQLERGFTSGAMALEDRAYSGAFGDGRRIAWALPQGRRLVDTHVDHAGWAFVAGVFSAGDVERDVAVGELILQSWHWLPAATRVHGPSASG